ncbi:uncharacterized protein GIQ15_01493 [Arthroderma uncinatum]|uniref:uncharacterized protein n=1 Tax=Arthroderma uncinatum TaxID=74035 RepID=UPI00144A6385|nr:uncharacterized protein GIQ15_01493 [Arthroderma uncinatum]KAF3491976.1 hypothetical protein GIQ15_01493 [Arthroderma uncinatum]
MDFPLVVPQNYFNDQACHYNDQACDYDNQASHYNDQAATRTTTPTTTATPTTTPTTTSARTTSTSSTVTPTPTSTTPVPAQSAIAVPFGQIIKGCTVNGTVAITFDDGPYDYTSELLDIFDSNGAKATLFVNAQNFGSITSYSAVLQRAFNGGHQIASHTYDHADLSTLTRAGIVSEMTKLDDVLASIINGNRPTYMRAPYFAYNTLVLQTMADLKYHVIDANIDTKDYEHDTADGVAISVSLFEQQLDAGGSIALAHDVHQTTVELLVQQLLDELKNRGLRAVTVGECLGDPKANWYRTTPVQTTTTTPTPTPTPTPTTTSTRTTTTATSSTKTTVPPPAPTQAGAAANCTKWHTVVSGDGCWDLSNQYGIALSDFYTWNPAVGSNCANMWLGYAVCVGIN